MFIFARNVLLWVRRSILLTCETLIFHF